MSFMDCSTGVSPFMISTLFDFGALIKIAAVKDLTKNANINPEYAANPFSYMVKSKRPRCIKTHLHWSLLPEQIRNGTKQPKIVTVIRNAADVCVSLYYHSQTVDGYKGTFEDFCELFLAGRVCFGPFWKQVYSYWEQKDRPNVLFIRYNEIKDDLPAVIRTVSQFLEKSLTEDQVAKLAEHLSFDAMKKNPMVNRGTVKEDMMELGMSTAQTEHFRSGKGGGYKSMMSPELVARFEAWSTENLAGTGLSLE